MTPPKVREAVWEKKSVAFILEPLNLRRLNELKRERAEKMEKTRSWK